MIKCNVKTKHVYHINKVYTIQKEMFRFIATLSAKHHDVSCKNNTKNTTSGIVPA